MAEENLLLRMRAMGARGTAHDVDRVTKSVVGLNKATTNTRISLGPFSTGFRGATLALGGFLLAVKSAVPFTLALAEGIGTAGAAAGGAGLVGLTAFGQATVVAKLGAGDLTKALGGNTAAYKKLTPEARRFYNTLYLAGAKLKGTAQRGLLPGLMGGAKSALGNLPILNRLVGQTSRTVGGLGRSAGGVLGGKSFGHELGQVGKTNTVVIANLGRAAIHAAVGFAHIVHAAGPLTMSLSRSALAGSKFFESWTKNKNTTGDMARFFKEGRRDLTLLASATGHLTGGVLNLFGAKDVDGTQTLKNLDRLTARFDHWTQSIVGKPLGPELQKQMAIALGQFAGFLGRHLAQVGVTAATAFWVAFTHAGIWGQGITTLWFASKFGALGKASGGAFNKAFARAFVAVGAVEAAMAIYNKLTPEAKPSAGLKFEQRLSAAQQRFQGLQSSNAPLGQQVDALGAWKRLQAQLVGPPQMTQTGPLSRIGGPGLKGGIASNAAFNQSMAQAFAQLGQLQPIVVHLDVDGKTIATAVHRAGTKKKSTK